MITSTKTNGAIRSIRFRGIGSAAKELGIARDHLYRILKGERPATPRIKEWLAANMRVEVVRPQGKAIRKMRDGQPRGYRLVNPDLDVADPDLRLLRRVMFELDFLTSMAAKRIGVGQSTIKKVLAGTKTSKPVIDALWEACEVQAGRRLAKGVETRDWERLVAAAREAVGQGASAPTEVKGRP
jgi:transcriptional regulator with XRE-family HTH domain